MKLRENFYSFPDYRKGKSYIGIRIFNELFKNFHLDTVYDPPQNIAKSFICCKGQ